LFAKVVVFSCFGNFFLSKVKKVASFISLLSSFFVSLPSKTANQYGYSSEHSSGRQAERTGMRRGAFPE
jgi:hypothetical protein